ncbi:peptidyl-prolyl cis-trans isomerase CYP59-like [Chenopodium quinoa]|uniref:Peptidyl-prolyl cis-trans isomerase n=1 Tax=Chenopodium quinoa TaxID=63459 RepID=A0A803MZ44_CHEQI|nr:peptidyl-prolyl cis-trans isomerase CYP59-like [Chenopodium quinoa]
MSVMVETSLGEFVIDLFTERCPLTCKNFLKLCKIKYYNGCLFHTVQKDFTAQTGDPTGTGSGGDSIYKFLYGDQARFFKDEIYPDVKHSKKGTVAMASAGENLNASQFYITLRDELDYLDEKHTVFGEIAEGHETLTRINEAYLDEKGRPFKNIRIKHTYVLDDPFEDPPQLASFIPDASPEGKPKEEVDDDVRLEDDWEPMDEQLPPEELEEAIRTKEAHSRAVVLESIGDIPDADVKPPDNVLFVCKLNPVTEDEDLHTIFSRFGTVTSAEVIRDFKTGDSLCYAFIEFESNDACERAYFKMDNALIDDRRIKVDFSQSVSKLWNQFRRKGTQGRGCFKCGALDHVAKDCSMGEMPGQHQKYVLKEDNQQHGGNKDAGYEMVFDEDGGSPKREKRHRDYEQDREKHKFQRRNHGDDKHRRDGNRDSRDSERRRYKNDNRDGHGGRRDERERGNSHGRDGKERESSHGREDRNRKESRYDRRIDQDCREKKNDGDNRKMTEDIDKLSKRDGANRSKDRDRRRDSDFYEPSRKEEQNQRRSSRDYTHGNNERRRTGRR